MPVLNPPSRSFGQEVRLKLRTLKNDDVLLISESPDDARTMAKYLANNVRFKPASGKRNSLAAHEYLTESEHRNVLFMVDCDGEDNKKILNLPNLIITDNRDLESDYFLILGAFKELTVQALLRHPEHEDIYEVRVLADKINSFVVDVAEKIGRIRTQAARAKLKIKVTEEGKRPRKLDARDLSNIEQRSATLAPFSYEEISKEFAAINNWDENWPIRLGQWEKTGNRKICRKHTENDCSSCKVRRFANGHDLIQLAARAYNFHVLRKPVDSIVDYKAFEELLRSSGSHNATEWSMVTRSRKFEAWSNKQVLRQN